MGLSFFETQDLRERGVELYGSPNFPHNFGAIASGAFSYLDLEQDIRASAKYLPLESAVITNHSSEDVDIEINGIFYAQIPAGVIETISQAIRTIRATNNDTGAVGAGLLRANIKTPPLGADEAARRRLIRSMR